MNALETENGAVTALVQAMLGSITPRMRYIAVSVAAARVRVIVVLEEDQAVDREIVDDVAVELWALLPNGLQLDVDVVVSAAPRAVPSGRLVYSRYEGR